MNLGLAKEVPVARDQVHKWYVWIMTAFQGASFSRYRIELTKIASLVYVADDIFVLVSTQEERSCFTQAVKTWNSAAADSLPSCMRSCYRALYSVTNDMADMVEKEHGVNPINHLKKAWAVLFDGFMIETKWLSDSHVPASEDYLRNGVVTSGVPLMFLHLLFMLGHDFGADAEGFIDHIPPVISCPAKIFRLWDDMGCAKEGLDGSYKELYLKENPGFDAGDAEEHMRGLITSKWEELNREYFFSRRAFPAGFSQAALNAARMVGVMYGHDGKQRLPVLEDYLRMLLF
uniref:Terpene synthase metal-binding domain-containing protein n=1 Tax=Leersia perrieri TaxID=77586 RepID=A0A0D9XKX7_9ORYZ